MGVASYSPPAGGACGPVGGVHPGGDRGVGGVDHRGGDGAGGGGAGGQGVAAGDMEGFNRALAWFKGGLIVTGIGGGLLAAPALAALGGLTAGGLGLGGGTLGSAVVAGATAAGIEGLAIGALTEGTFAYATGAGVGGVAEAAFWGGLEGGLSGALLGGAFGAAGWGLGRIGRGLLRGSGLRRGIVAERDFAGLAGSTTGATTEIVWESQRYSGVLGRLLGFVGIRRRLPVDFRIRYRPGLSGRNLINLTEHELGHVDWALSHPVMSYLADVTPAGFTK